MPSPRSSTRSACVSDHAAAVQGRPDQLRCRSDGHGHEGQLGVRVGPDRIDRTVALIGRAGALYPFFRSSALLRNLDQKTRNVPVVLLYPGECVPRNDHVGLSFMGILDADHDYRPRIYQ